MMDDEAYVFNALGRIIAYQKNNIFPGKQLILTHETSNCPMNSKIIEMAIQTYLM